MSTLTYKNIKGQGHSLILVQSHLDSTASNFFSWKTAGPIEAKFHVKPQSDGWSNVCLTSLCHMTKMAAVLIYGKNMKNSSSLEPNGRWPWRFICSIGYSSTTKFIQMMTLTYITARSNLVPYAFVWEKVKTMDFSETIIVYDIKVGRCSQPNEYMKLYEYQRSRSLIDLNRNLSDSLFLNFFSSIITRPIETKLYMEPLWDGWTKVCSNGPGHITKMVAMPIYGKNN